jgi:hypothetical protein
MASESGGVPGDSCVCFKAFVLKQVQGYSAGWIERVTLVRFGYSIFKLMSQPSFRIAPVLRGIRKLSTCPYDAQAVDLQKKADDNDS